MLAILTASLVLLALAPPAGAVLSGKNGRIAFTSGRTGGDATAQIFLKSVIGSTGGGTLSPPITPIGGQSRHASWSPDRTKLVFANGTPGAPTTENYDLFVKDFVNGTITPLDGNEVADSKSSDHPAWSPDGRRIAYEHQPSAGSADRNIMVKTVGTSAAAVPLTSGGPVEFKPAWSPDSQTIYYATTLSSPQYMDIVKKAATAGPATAPTNVQAASGLDEYQPSISPDGTKMCFTGQNPGNSATAEIYVMSLAAPGALTNISKDSTQGDINCTWSPDGTLIAYVNGTFSTGELVMKRADNTSPFAISLANDPGNNDFDGNPDWAPDGRPICPPRGITTTVNQPVTVDLTCADTGPDYERTTVRDFNRTDPTSGTLTQNLAGDPYTYTPNQGFTGSDSFQLDSFDEFGFGEPSGRSTVTIKVNPASANGGGRGVTGGGGAILKCGGKAATIVGTSSKDNLIGTNGRDVIVGLGGDDRIRGGRGNDIICGGSGRDRIDGGSSNDRVSGGSGSDKLYGKSGKDSLKGNSGNDRISGGSGKDKLYGGSGKDKLYGGSGRDYLKGDSGRDRLSGGSGRDRLNGGSSKDRCNGGSGRDRGRRCERRSSIP